MDFVRQRTSDVTSASFFCPHRRTAVIRQLTEARPLVVVSACLLGHAVRHDGGHTRARFLTDELSKYVDFATVCPEEGAGMGTPREPVRLVRSSESLSIVGSKSGRDWTERVERYSKRTTSELVPIAPVAFILKKGSPSCGVFRVRRYNAAGNRLPSNGPGLFAAHVLETFGDLPVEDEGRLNDPGLRHQFLIRLFAAHRVQQLRMPRTTRADVMEFHRKEKLLLMAHSPARQKELGRLIANATGATQELVERYRHLFLQTLSEKTHRGRIVNVFQHMAGYLRGHLDQADTTELIDAIAAFADGLRSASAVWTLLNHHLRKCKVGYLLDQTVSESYPPQLLLGHPDPHIANRTPSTPGVPIVRSI
jgi:uncharacterized protein YbbK (DUF523 family)/uncharacterized protein YbgA (DUF1722 family)